MAGILPATLRALSRCSYVQNRFLRFCEPRVRFQSPPALQQRKIGSPLRVREPIILILELVGVRGFEPPAPASRRQCSTRLSYTPFKGRKNSKQPCLFTSYFLAQRPD